MGNHNLKIETGRHTNPKMPENMRICDHCDSKDIENETHFLYQCKHYDKIRNNLYNDITSQYKQFRDLNLKDKTLFLFNNVDPFVCKKFAYFIFKAFEMRNTVLIIINSQWVPWLFSDCEHTYSGGFLFLKNMISTITLLLFLQLFYIYTYIDRYGNTKM